MNIFEITEENIDDLADNIREEFVNEIRRVYVRGMAGADDDGNLIAQIFWELKHVEDMNTPNQIKILWFQVNDAADGMELLNAMEEREAENNVVRIYYEFPDLGAEGEEALRKSGYTTKAGEGSVVNVTVAEIAAMKILKKKPENYVLSLSDITTRQFRTGIMNCVFHGKFGILEDLPFLSINRFDMDVSCCIVPDEKVDGYLLLNKITTGCYRVELFVAMQPDANVHLLNMMRFAARKIYKLEPPETTVRLTRHNEATIQLIDKLFPDKKGEDVIKGEKNIVKED